MTNPRNFLLNTDYPLDKVVYITTGSIVVPNGTNSTLTLVAHSLPFTPLPMLQWSNTADFTITNEFRDSQYNSNSFTTGVGQYYNVTANGTNIYIDRYNFSGSSQTVYYRISCFAPSNASVDSLVPFTSTSGSEFILNTDNNYMKLGFSGILTTVANTFTHNIGYAPRAFIWGNSGGFLTRLVSAQELGGGAGTAGVHITPTQLVWLSPSTYTEIHYRIYYDE